MVDLDRCIGPSRYPDCGARMISKREALQIRQAVRELVSAEIAYFNRVIIYPDKNPKQARELRIAKARLTSVLESLTVSPR